MTCAVFDSWQRGRITEAVFRSHAGRCPDCRRQLEQDQRMMEPFAALPLSRPSAELWPAIEAALQQEQNRSHRSAWTLLARVAAVFIMAIGLAGGLYFRPGDQSAGLLSDQAMKNAQARQVWCERSIQQLERQLRTLTPARRDEWASRQQGRLKTIDQHLQRCRRASIENPANAHIQRSLLNALYKKQNMLQQIVQSSRQVPLQPEWQRRIS